MAKNILIVPSNTIAPEASRIPYISFENTTIVGLQVLSGATIAFSADTVSNVLSINENVFCCGAKHLHVFGVVCFFQYL